MKSSISNRVDYLTKDYEGFRSLLIDLIPTITPEWTDLSRSDFGIVLIELLSHGLDILSFYQDRAVQESFIDTAQTKKAIVSICRLLGYELSQPTPAKTTIVFKKSEDFIDSEIKILKGTKVGTSSENGEQLIFELDDELTIPTGVLGDEKDEEGKYLYKVTATQGITIYNDLLGVGDGEPNQKFTINNEEVLLDTIELITLENGVNRTWGRVSDFLNSDPNSRHYRAYKEGDGNIIIEFGDGITGTKLPFGASLYVSYRQGGGTKGNVGVNTIVEFVDSNVVGIEELFNPTGVDVQGTDEEDIEHAKTVAPRIFRTMGRAVTRQDYEDIVLNVSGVEKAQAKETFNENRDLYLYIVPSTYDACSQELLDTVKDYIDKVKLAVDNVIVQSATFVPYDLEINIKVLNYYDAEVVKQKVIEVLTDSLHPKYFNLSETIPLAYIFREVMLVEGVQNVQIVNQTNDLTCSEGEILKLNTLTINIV